MENWLIDVPRRMGLTICTRDCLLPPVVLKKSPSPICAHPAYAVS
jgi:hypothetical protein